MQDTDQGQKIRLDKWLWHARFFKTRSIAAKEVGAGHVRVNSERVVKPATVVRAQDVLTFTQGRQVRVIRILGIGTRRGPAPEAQALYDDLDPPEARASRDDVPQNPAYDGKGRPTKKVRRKLDLNRSGALE
ncbi:RNA-binding S4 domain-containing protein [Roseovarius sp. ZX-A-9]|uniref:RNA-binding S4 domain-containing protein n=1 Tax=Roseovarius sp. ZX-A-9 TaxID=3014783 RepID=UPI00232CB67A|nr:RNA-binding S4 domain-containing protein [Roseovarius sp. ZX-A-9]MDX1786040.1 RNA-binding S4 domain-containing protein [Roseovarius sp.]